MDFIKKSFRWRSNLSNDNIISVYVSSENGSGFSRPESKMTVVWNQGQNLENWVAHPHQKVGGGPTGTSISISIFLSWKGNIILRRKVFNWYWDVYMKWFVKCNIHRTARSIRFMYFERAFKKRGETNHGHSSEIQTTEKWVKLKSGSYLKQSSSRLWI